MEISCVIKKVIMFRSIITFCLFIAYASICIAQETESKLLDRCVGSTSQYQCLGEQLAISVAELEASVSAVRKMMALWEEGPTRKVAEENFEKTVAEFERYRKAQCEYFASMRYGLGDQDEVEIVRLKCMLKLNAERTKVFTDLTATIIM